MLGKIEAAQGRLQKVEEKLFSKVSAKNRLSTASTMKNLNRILDFYNRHSSILFTKNIPQDTFVLGT